MKATRLPPRRRERLAVGGLGILLLIAGGCAIVAHLNRLRWLDAHAPMLTTGSLPSWASWAIAAVAVLVGIIGGRLVSVLVLRSPGTIAWSTRADGSQDRTIVSAGTMSAPVAAEIEGYDGVCSALAWLSGPGRSPTLSLVVAVTPEADVVGLRRRILADAMPRLRQALEADSVAVSMEVRVVEPPKTTSTL